MYKYELMKGSRHIVCPGCGKKRFKPYVHTGTMDVVDASKFGRCERINTCGYHLYPTGVKSEHKYKPSTPEPPEPPKPPDFIPVDIVESTFHMFNKNIFFRWLVKLFGVDTAYELQEKYNIGTAKNGGTIFWQQDKNMNFRTGKVMYYSPSGKRIKNKVSWYLHTKIKEDYNLQQVFFGEHLIHENKPIALCESEKTAILMSHFEPKYTWLASGHANMVSLQRISRLPRLDIIYPDNGMREKWEQQTALFNGRNVDTTVDIAVMNGELSRGADILDLYLKNIKV